MLTAQSGQLGGLELRQEAEARLLQELGYEPTIAIGSFPRSAEWQTQLRGQGIPVMEFDRPAFFEEWRWRRINRLRALAYGAMRLPRAGFDLAHVFFAWTNAGGTRLWLAHRFGIPSIISVHNTFTERKFAPPRAAIMAQAFASVRGIYGVSQAALDRFARIFGEFIRPGTLLRVIYNFVDTERFVPSETRRAEARKALGIPANAPVIGSIGRLDRQKRPESVVAAFARLKLRHPNSYLVMVGQGPLEESVRRQASALGVDDSVMFTGFHTRAEELMPMFDIHLLLSHIEGFGIATAEAMACGVATVTTDVDGSREVVGADGAGILVPLGDEDAAADAMSRILSSAEMAQSLSRRGRHNVMSRFGKPAWESAIVDFYASVLTPGS